LPKRAGGIIGITDVAANVAKFTGYCRLIGGMFRLPKFGGLDAIQAGILL
jgi:hypothetical protein